MANLTNPVAGSIALPAALAPPSVAVPGTPGLAAFVDLMIGQLASPVAGSAPKDGERQDDAAGGKILPDEDKDKAIDPALAWLWGPAPLPVPQPVTVPVPAGGRGGVASPPGSAAAVVAPLPLPEIAPPQTTTPEAVQMPVPQPDAGPTAPERASVKPAPVAIEPRVGPAAPAPPPPAAAPPAAAALPALFALSLADRMPAERDDAPLSLQSVAATAQPVAIAAVAPAGDTQRQQLDMAGRDWPQKMIDRIEALRDDANANDTSIRLKPEALGRVDVALRTHADGAISVRFTAEQPTTRTLIADAAPQLTAAAEARGIRLSGTSVDLSGQGQEQRARPEFDRREPITNRIAPPGDDIEAVSDGRIA